MLFKMKVRYFKYMNKVNLLKRSHLQKIMKKRNEFRNGRRGTPMLTGSNLPSIHEEQNERRPSALLNVPIPTSPTSLSTPDAQVSGDANSNSTSNTTTRASLE